MKERPILFSAPMVQALLAGRKTQTRRVVNRLQKFGKITEFGKSDTTGYDWHFRDRHWLWNDLRHARMMGACPWGQPGDRLWVREGFLHELAGSTDQNGEWNDWYCGKGCAIEYVADGAKERHLHPHQIPSTYMKRRPSIHMPRWASRIMLEITDVQVQRVQEISPEDCLAEGIEAVEGDGLERLDKFESLWDSINAARGYGWEANPWVWAVSFKLLEAKK